jgi:cytidylate kinase
MSFAEPRSPDDDLAPLGERTDSPRHGFRGEKPLPPLASGVPASLTITVSREAGSRGSTIATRAGQKLGWPVYNQELLEYIAHEGAFRQNFAENLSAPAVKWAERCLEKLLREQNMSQHPTLIELARVVLSLGAEGEVVLIGRGAGFILPRESTLNVRIIAPQEERIAYMSQWLRLPTEEAAEQVRLRDERRAQFLTTHFHRHPTDIYQYDLLLNSSLLGEDLCAELIVLAARAKLAAANQTAAAPPPWMAESVE